MYKCLFFISLGINAVVLAVSLVDQEKPTQSESVTVKVNGHSRPIEKSDLKPISNVKEKRIRAKQKTKDDQEIEQIKETLYQSKVEMLNLTYSFFFSENQLDLTEEELETLRIALIKNPPEHNCDCGLPVGFTHFKLSLLKKGFDLTTSNSITDMLIKQEFYENLNSNIFHGTYQKDMHSLVYDLHQMRDGFQETKREKVFAKPVSSFDEVYYYTLDFEDAKVEQSFHNPFAESDPFSTYPYLEELSEEEFEALRLTNIKSLEDSLTPDGQVLYHDTISILNNYLDVDDKIKLRTLDYLKKDFFYGH